MALRTYRDCTLREKRDVLRVFWSGRPDERTHINQAAKEYAPYALCLVGIICVELLIITALLAADASDWAGLSSASAVLVLWCAGWTEMCRRRIAAAVGLR